MYFIFLFFVYLKALLVTQYLVVRSFTESIRKAIKLFKIQVIGNFLLILKDFYFTQHGVRAKKITSKIVGEFCENCRSQGV